MPNIVRNDNPTLTNEQYAHHSVMLDRFGKKYKEPIQFMVTIWPLIN